MIKNCSIDVEIFAESYKTFPRHNLPQTQPVPLIAHPHDLYNALSVAFSSLLMTTQSLEKSTLDVYEKLKEVHLHICKDEDDNNLHDSPQPSYFLAGDLARKAKKGRSTVYEALRLLLDVGRVAKRKVGREAHYYLMEDDDVYPDVSEHLNHVQLAETYSNYVRDKLSGFRVINEGDTHITEYINPITGESETYEPSVLRCPVQKSEGKKGSGTLLDRSEGEESIVPEVITIKDE